MILVPLLIARPAWADTSDAKPAEPDSPNSPEAKKKREWDEASGLVGIRGSALTVSGSDHDATTHGLSFWVSGTSYGAVGSMGRTRATFFGGLGGGSGGFEGALGGSSAIGLRLPVTDDQGPVARLGIDGFLMGNDTYYHSSLQFPQAQLGYQVLTRGEGVFEIGGTAAPVLDGRLDVGTDARRKLGGSLGVGGYASFQQSGFAGNLGWSRVFAQSDPGTPVDWLTLDVCFAVGIGVCFDARYMRGDVVYGAPAQVSQADARYLGLTLGFGGTK
jgi:hypothetical protein